MIILGAGWFGMNFFWAFYTGPMPLFLKDFTDSKFMISLVLSLAGVMNCIVPPIAGYLSDRTITRYGRRKPYVLFGELGMLLCMLSLPYAGTFPLVALISAAAYSSVAFAETPLTSLLPDITPPEQRSTVSGVVHLLGSVGLITSFAIGSGIWDKHPTAVFHLVALIAFGSMLFPIALVREPEVERGNPSKRSLNPVSYLRSIAKETNAVKFFVAQSFWWLGLNIVSAFMTLFLVEELKVSEGKSLLVPMTLTIVATVAALPLGILGDRIGRKKILSSMIAIWVFTGVLIGFTQNFTTALIIAAVSGIPFAAALTIGYAFMLDLIPKERTAEFVGFNMISLSAPMIFGPPIGGKLIDMFGYRLAFPMSVVFTIIGLVILQSIHPRHASPEEPK